MYGRFVCGKAAAIVGIAFRSGSALFDVPLGIFVAAFNICTADHHSREGRVIFHQGAHKVAGHLTAVVSYTCDIG